MLKERQTSKMYSFDLNQIPYFCLYLLLGDNTSSGHMHSWFKQCSFPPVSTVTSSYS